MDFIIAADTDIGIKKNTNQDSLMVRKLNTPLGKMVLAVLCDGMGGLAKGEVASAEIINAFDKWMRTSLPVLCRGGLSQTAIESAWSELINRENIRIMQYGRGFNVNIGTTVVAMLLTENEYFLMNVGDSRGYEISENLNQLTTDHTLVAREIGQGILTPEQAESDPRRSVLLQCIGASEEVMPTYRFGEVKANTVYMLCSDGFIHEATEEELFRALSPSVMVSKEIMKNQIDSLIDLVKVRLEKDNISVITVRTF